MKFTEFRMTSTALLVVSTLILGSILALAAGLTMDDPMIVYGVIYSSIFTAIAWRFPALALAITFASAPFQNDLSGGSGIFRFSVAELNLLFCGMVFLFRRITQQRGIKLGPSFVPVILYLTVCLASSLVDWHQESVVPALLQMCLYFLLAVMVFANFADKPEHLLWSYNFLLGVCLFLSLYGLTTGSFFIFGLHKNGVGSSLACGIIISMEMWMAAEKGKMKTRYFLSTIIIAAGLIFTLSRGAWIGALVGMTVVILLRGKFKFMLQLFLIMIPIVAVFWNLLPQESKDYASDFSSKRDNINARYVTIDYAREQFEKSPFYGVGVGLRKEIDATNVFWITLAETGVPGLLAFGGLHVVVLLMIYKSLKKMKRNDRLYPLMAATAGLLINKLVHGLVDHYWSRGPLMMVWASVGMATMVYFKLQEREAVEMRTTRLAIEEEHRQGVIRARAARASN